MRSVDPPDAARTEEVATAMEIWGSPVRVLLFEYIREHPNQVLGQIYEATRSDVEQLTGKNFSSPNLSRHLRTMKEAGVVKVDLPPELVKGRSPRYSVDEERADALIDGVVNFVDGYRRSKRG